MKASLYVTSAIALATTVVAGSPAHAQDQVTVPNDVAESPAKRDDRQHSDNDVIVTGRREGYAVESSAATTRVDLDIRATPSSISVLTDTYLDDRAVTDLRDALQLAAGISLQQCCFNGSGIIIRGAFLNEGISGIRQDGIATAYPTYGDIASLDRLEVIKGPSAIVGGASSIGGVVNRVTKTPLDTPFREVEVQAGSFGLLRAQGDVSTPLGGGAAFRVVAAYEHDGLFSRGRSKNQYIVAPSFRWKPSPQTTVTAIAELQRYDGNPFIGIPLNADGSLPDLPRSISFGTDFARETAKRAVVAIEHDFLDGLKLSAKAGASSAKMSALYAYAYASYGLGPDFVASIYPGARRRSDRIYTGELFASKEFEFGGRKQQLLIGADYADQRNQQDYAYGDSLGQFDLREPIDIVTPEEPLTPDNPNASLFGTRREQYSVFGQAVLRPLDGLTLVGALRHDWFAIDTENIVGGPAIRFSDDPRATTGRIGGAYEIVGDLSLYANYAETFLPQPDVVTVDGSTIPPEEGKQVEAGVKYGRDDGSFLATLGFYRAIRSNVATTDPDNPNFSIAAGKVRFQGIEFEARGQIAPGLNVAATYAYTEAEVTEDNVLAIGSNFTQSPRHQATIYGQYEFGSGRLRGLGLSAGVFRKGRVPAFLDRDYTFPGYTTVDAGLYYRGLDNVELQVNLRNLTDARFAESIRTNTYGAKVGAPRNVTFRAVLRF